MAAGQTRSTVRTIAKSAENENRETTARGADTGGWSCVSSNQMAQVEASGLHGATALRPSCPNEATHPKNPEAYRRSEVVTAGRLGVLMTRPGTEMAYRSLDRHWRHEKPGIRMGTLRVTRCESVRLAPDPRRVIAKSFVPREEIYADGSTRMDAVLMRLMAMPDAVVSDTLDEARRGFAVRHRDLGAVFEQGFMIVAPHLDQMEASGSLAATLTIDRRQLIGAYFTHEYSIEAAALGNPSMVVSPDQSGLAAGEVRFVMSLRSIGEGHISSIEFRSGVVGADAAVRPEPPSPFAAAGARRPGDLDKALFAAKLAGSRDVQRGRRTCARTFAGSVHHCRYRGCECSAGMRGVERSISGETTRLLHWLASSHYCVSLPAVGRHL